MTSKFVDYLNSMNSADANGKGALAEWQVQSPFYDRIVVRRSVSDYLLQQVTSTPSTIILTGHAGDGKTSLLAQLLKDLNCLPEGEKLKRSDEVIAPQGTRLLYVKDMSELTKHEQEALLRQALQGPARGYSAVLVSNTGPLINTAERLIGGNEAAQDAIIELLDRMDTNGTEPLTIAGYPCYVINMARLDNVHIAGQVLANMLEPGLWSTCAECEGADNCPIRNNQRAIARRPERVIHFAEAFYRYLQEHDNRLTVRQIVSHLSFMLTGNLSCGKATSLKPAARFSYHFANLFFGHLGRTLDPTARQIKAVMDLNSLALDGISLRADYNLFVKQDYSCFDAQTSELLRQADHQLRRHTSADETARLLHRRAIRRFYMICSLKDEKQQNDLLAEIYSPIFPVYVQALTSNLDMMERKKLQTLVVTALHTLFTGMPPVDSDEIPLTVRRDGVATQYVQLLKGYVPNHQISVVTRRRQDTAGQDKALNEIVLRVSSFTFPLNYPLIEHFRRIANGAVATTLTPSLSHGIDRLKANLMKMYSHDNSDEQKQFSLLLQTNKGTKRLRCELVGKKLYIE